MIAGTFGVRVWVEEGVNAFLLIWFEAFACGKADAGEHEQAEQNNSRLAHSHAA